MKRLNLPNFKNINDSIILDNLVIRNNTNSFEYSSWRRDLEYNSTISLSASFNEQIKEKLKFPQTYFLNGNIILNDANSSSSNDSGLFISKGINLLLSNLSKTPFNELGVEKTILKVTFSGNTNNTYIYKNNNDNEPIGEIIYKDDTGCWIELYLSTTSLNTNELVYFSNSPNNVGTISETYTVNTSTENGEYSDVPIFKQLKISTTHLCQSFLWSSRWRRSCMFQGLLPNSETSKPYFL